MVLIYNGMKRDPPCPLRALPLTVEESSNEVLYPMTQNKAGCSKYLILLGVEKIGYD